MDKQTDIDIIRQYTVTGVPATMIPMLFNELNLNLDAFYEWHSGKTCGIVGGETMIYPWCIKRFVELNKKE